MIRAGDSIHNPVTGERIVFRQTSADTNGEAVVIETYVEPHGFVAAAHVHPSQEERFQVLRGTVGFKIGRTEQVAGPGTRVTVPAGTPHRFWNAGDEELTLTGEVFPAGNLEFFLSAIYASVAAHGGRPGALDAAYLLTRYRTEFAMTAIPAPVTRFVLPLQALFGRAFGRYSHFADAPNPISRPMSATLPGRTTSARSSAG